MNFFLSLFPIMASMDCILKILAPPTIPRSYTIGIIQTSLRDLKYLTLAIKFNLKRHEQLKQIAVFNYFCRSHEQFPLVNRALFRQNVNDYGSWGHVGDEVCKI